MKILFVSPRYNEVGGVEYVVRSLAERLVEKFEVEIMTGGDRIAEYESNGIKVYEHPTFSPNNAYHIPLKRGELVERLKSILREVDVVHVHNFHSVFSVWIGKKAKEIADIKLIATGHYHSTGHSTVRKVLWIPWKRYLKRFLERVDKIHTISQLEKERILKDFPSSKDKLVLIPNGVDEDVFRYEWRGENSDYMMYAGRIEKYKRIEKAIEVAKELNLRILIVGSGSYKSTLVDYSKRIYSNVEFLKPLPRDEYLKLLSNTRYAINPSEREAFGLFTAEAMAIGVPVIGSIEVAKAIGAELKEKIGDLFLLDRIRVKSWSEVVKEYMEKLYAFKS